MYELIELPKLESLLLNRTRVTDAGLKLIPYFKNLKQVQIWETRGVTKGPGSRTSGTPCRDSPWDTRRVLVLDAQGDSRHAFRTCE